ncbi:MAG: hypothetical protein EXQ96_06310 [Alphaproteobacteria bacterium]|nr:hypothetical protein [Alphaproteobacteria bacterium]
MALTFQDVGQALALLDGCAGGRARLAIGDLRIAVETDERNTTAPAILTVVAPVAGRFVLNPALRPGSPVGPTTMLGTIAGPHGDRPIEAGIVGWVRGILAAAGNAVVIGQALVILTAGNG